MTRHIFTKALIAASALTVLAAAPSAMAATEKPISAKVKTVKANQLKTAVKLADNNRSFRNRNSNRTNRNTLRRNNFNRSLLGSSSLLGRSTFGTSRLRTSSLLGSNRSFFTPYRSSLGISFSFGSPGYSRYRWSQSPFSLYRSSYGSFGAYQTRTICNRVTLEGRHYGRPALISVKQCSNPWDGTYIIQGSERLLTSRW